MSERINRINGYIERAHRILEESNEAAAKQFQEDVLGEYEAVISGLTYSLSTYNPLLAVDENTPINYLKDARLLKNKLERYRAELIDSESCDRQQNSAINIVNQNQNIQSVTIENAISSIASLPESALSGTEKEKLKLLLEELQTEKNRGSDRSTIWDKIKPILLFLLDKGADVAIAVLPSLLGIL